MQKKMIIPLVVAVLLICLVSSVGAHSSIKLFINGQELKSDVSPTIVGGRVLVPIRVITEKLGAFINWNDKERRVDVDSGGVQAQNNRITLLEKALAPENPDAAVKSWAEGVKTRNGALQYAVMSPQLKKESYSDFVAFNWSTGTSSPWIMGYEVNEKCKVNSDRYRFEVIFTYTDSTKANFTIAEYITVDNFEGTWLVSSLEKIDLKGEITKITRHNNKQIKSIFVEDTSGARKGYDKANVLIGSGTKIYDGYTDRELTERVLEEGVTVEVVFTDDPVAESYPVTAKAKIIRVMGETQTGLVVYRNDQYSFSFSLPKSWKGYTIVTDRWEGLSLEEAKKSKVIESGPILLIRHPQWTRQNQRQDIPIMIFTREQWNMLQQEKFHIGAAPMGPKEIGRNSRYVFALPARYNYAFPTGYEEVEKILENNPLKPFEN